MKMLLNKELADVILYGLIDHQSPITILTNKSIWLDQEEILKAIEQLQEKQLVKSEPGVAIHTYNGKFDPKPQMVICGNYSLSEKGKSFTLSGFKFAENHDYISSWT